MLYSKLIDVFSVLDSKEIKLLRKFVYSPLYNQHKDVCVLFEHIVGLDKYTEENLNKQVVYKALFPKSNYNDLRLRHVVSYLLRVCEACLAHMESQKDASTNRLNLMKAYRKRNLRKHFENELLLYKKAGGDSAKKDAGYYLNSAQLKAEVFDALFLDKKTRITNLSEADAALSFYFILSKLKNRCKLLAEMPDSLDSKISLLQEIKTLIKAENLLRFPEIDIHYHAVLAFEYREEISFFKLFKEKLSIHSQYIEFNELKELFSLAIQYCQSKLSQGETEFRRDLFELYLHGLASEALLNEQRLSLETQKNIVEIGLSFDEITWVKDFISDSKHLTDKSYCEELFQLNTAKVHFAKKNYKGCLTALAEIKTKNNWIAIDSKQLKIKVLSELKDTVQQKSEMRQLKSLLQKTEKQVVFD